MGSCRIDPFTEGTRDGIGTSTFSDACVILMVHNTEATYFFFPCAAFPLSVCKHRLSGDIYAATQRFPFCSPFSRGKAKETSPLPAAPPRPPTLYYTSGKRDQRKAEKRCRSLHPAADHAFKAELLRYPSKGREPCLHTDSGVRSISGCETATRTLGSSVTFPTQRVKLISASIQAFPQNARCSTENQKCR